MKEFIRKSTRAVAVKWRGNNLDEIRSVVSQKEILTDSDNRLSLAVNRPGLSDPVYIMVPPGWWVIHDGYELDVRSNEDFVELYESSGEDVVYKAPVEEEIAVILHREWCKWMTKVFEEDGEYLPKPDYKWIMDTQKYYRWKHLARMKWETMGKDERWFWLVIAKTIAKATQGGK